MNGVTIKSNVRDAKRLSALLSPTRNFEKTDARGEFFIASEDDVQARSDADFLTANGADVLHVFDEPTMCTETCGTYHCQRTSHGVSTAHESISGIDAMNPGCVRVLRWGAGLDETWVSRRVVR